MKKGQIPIGTVAVVAVILIFVTVAIVAISGGALFSLVNDRPVKSLTLDTDGVEFMEGGIMTTTTELMSYPGDDESYYLYYEIYDGDKFLRSAKHRIEGHRSYGYDSFNDEFILTGLEPGKHVLRYEYYWSVLESDRGCDEQYLYKDENGDVQRVKYVCKFMEEMAEQIDMRHREQFMRHFDPTVQWSKYFSGTLYQATEEQTFCIAYCGELVTEFIEKIVEIEKILEVPVEQDPCSVNSDCGVDGECITNADGKNFCVRIIENVIERMIQCQTDADCSGIGGVCMMNTNSESYCVKENIIEKFKTTPIIVGATCFEIDCSFGFKCVDEQVSQGNIAYCVQSGTAQKASAWWGSTWAWLMGLGGLLLLLTIVIVSVIIYLRNR